MITYNKNRNNILKIIFSSIIALFIFCSPIITCALDFEGQNYVIEQGRDEKISIPKMYTIENRLTYFGGENPFLNSPSDLFLGDNGSLYLSDSGNNRILKLNKRFEIEKEYKQAQGIEFNSPNGIFAYPNGEILIADTKNNRIVHLKEDGSLIKIYIKPESDLLGEVTSFEPNKVAINQNTGFIYIIQGKEFLTIDQNNEFGGFVGAQKLEFDLKDFLFRRFASDLQQRVVGRRQPPAYNNFYIGKDQAVYAVGMGSRDQIKIINSVDNNIYKSGIYGEITYLENGTPVYPVFTDITSGNNGIITAIEQNTAKIYQYDSEGNLLGVFGGKGKNNERFEVPCSIVEDEDGKIYILDSSNNSIQILKPTKFTQLIHNANGAYLKGDYVTARALWEDVLLIDANYPIARKSLGKIEFKDKNFQKSMEHYKIANDKEGYGKSFEKERYRIFRAKFSFVFFGITAIIIFLTWIIWIFYRKSKKYDDQLNGIGVTPKFPAIQLAILFLYHPIKANQIVKRRRDTFKIVPVLVLFFGAVLMRIISIYTVNYTVSDILPTQSNFFFEMAVILLPILTWVISTYGILTNLSGEAKLTESLTAVSYSLMPYIVTAPLLIMFSQVASYQEAEIYAGVKTLILIWQIVLILISLQVLNDIRFTKTILYTFIGVVGMAIIWSLCLLVFALTSQVGYFASELFQEIKLMIG